MAIDKYHWYDGWFYDRFIAPNQDKLFGQIKNLIQNEGTIIDIGCGTGRLEFTLSDKCKSITGIDLSKSNIAFANLKLLDNPNDKISFKHQNLSEIVNGGQTHFDYAVMTYVIHEVNEEQRILLLKDMSKVADKIIIGDYLVPRPGDFGSFLSEVIEFIAGREHYRNFKSYVEKGGIHYLADKAGLKVIEEITNHPTSNHIVVLVK